MFGMIPFARFERDMMKDFDRRAFGMRTDIKDEGEAYKLEAEIPGFEKDQIHVDVVDGMLTIKAEKNEENEQKGENGYVTRERRAGSFVRRFALDGIDQDNISGEYKNGVLALNLPKLRKESKSIEIN